MDYKNIIEQAIIAAEKAFNECTPTPVQFYEADITGVRSGKVYPVDTEGECGGAYLTDIKDKNFIKWCLEHGYSLDKSMFRSRGYEMQTPIKNYRGQSAAKYKAYAEGFAKILQENGIDCYVHDYLT